ncbi:MAG TPA: hypothetical protein VFA20_24545 [Myxococcaceae bacterium]|nr:hypothetical protein [Myxococcaceae bacterium]
MYLWAHDPELTEVLQTQLERLVREYLAAQQKAAVAAVERAFAPAAPRRARPPLCSADRERDAFRPDLAGRDQDQGRRVHLASVDAPLAAKHFETVRPP